MSGVELSDVGSILTGKQLNGQKTQQKLKRVDLSRRLVSLDPPAQVSSADITKDLVDLDVSQDEMYH